MVLKCIKHLLSVNNIQEMISSLRSLYTRFNSNKCLPVTMSHDNINTVNVEQKLSKIGLVGLAVMGQNLALNIAEKGYPISVYNRSTAKTDLTTLRAKKEGLDSVLNGYHDIDNFIDSLEKPRTVIMLVQAGAPVDMTIDKLSEYMEQGDIIIDGGNEWYENTERREKLLQEKGILYMGMGISGGEEGARNGPSMMPGGNYDAYKRIESIVEDVSAKVDNHSCVTYIGPGGSGNFVKMVHNGIEYGDMQLISEAYDILKHIGKFSNEELSDIFYEWNKSELQSYLIEITSEIFKKEDDIVRGQSQIDSILDKTGMKGTGKWTVQQAAELSVPIPTIVTSLEARFISGIKEERVIASEIYPYKKNTYELSSEERRKLIKDVKSALYASKICSYAQGMNLIRKKSETENWNLSLNKVAKIWKGGCIIRAQFLDRISNAYDINPELNSLLVDDYFIKELKDREIAWRRIVSLAVNTGIALPSMSASLSYFDSYRRENVPANLVQAQRDFFGSHTYERNDGREGNFHSIWSDKNSSDSITTTSYNN